jgi:molybdopterin synthase sulfur carrier subunit
MPSIRVPSALRTLTGGNADVDTTAATVREAIAELDRRYPGIAARVLDGNGGVKPFIRIFVRSEDITGLTGLDTPISGRDEVEIIPAIAGGAGAGAPGA